VVYTNQFPATQSGNYKLRFWIIFRGTTTVTGYTYDFDYFIAEVLRETDQLTVDQLTRVTNDSAGIKGIAANIKFGDSSQNSDRGALEIDDTNTSSWNRYGKTDEMNLQFLYCLQLLNDRASYKDIVSLRIKDASRTIYPYSVLTMNSKNYRFLSYNRTFRTAEIECQLIQILNTDITYTTEIIDVLAQEGVSTGGGSGTNNTGGSTTIFNITGGITSINNGDGTSWNAITKAVDVDNPIYRLNATYEGTISSSSILLIAAPGAGKMIQVLDVVVLGNTTSPTEPDAYLRYQGETENIAVIPMSDTAVKYYEIKPSAYELKANKGIVLSTDDVVTSGTGGIEFIVYYRVITWSSFTAMPVTTTTTTTA
jgi:hypothetical protein